MASCSNSDNSGRGDDPNSTAYNSPDNQRTRKHLQDLIKETVDTAAEVCQCDDCSRKRMQKQIIQDDMDELLKHLPSKMLRNPVGFTSELSSNPIYWRLGRRGSGSANEALCY
jgi:hypothetical protein